MGEVVIRLSPGESTEVGIRGVEWRIAVHDGLVEITSVVTETEWRIAFHDDGSVEITSPVMEQKVSASGRRPPGRPGPTTQMIREAEAREAGGVPESEGRRAIEQIERGGPGQSKVPHAIVGWLDNNWPRSTGRTWVRYVKWPVVAGFLGAGITLGFLILHFMK